VSAEITVCARSIQLLVGLLALVLVLVLVLVQLVLWLLLLLALFVRGSHGLASRRHCKRGCGRGGVARDGQRRRRCV
jgi:hypothetical protein